MAGKYRAVVEETRTLARVVTVDAIQPIKKADFIELAQVGGWQCIVKKGEFQVGDKGIYFEIDSLLPVELPLFAFLAERKENLKTFDGVVYSRIRTMKMKGEISQGLLLPMPEGSKQRPVGTNLTAELSVLKLEEVIVATEGFDGRLNRDGPLNWFEKLVRLIAGKPGKSPFGPWPAALSKSDQERVQNVGHHYAAAAAEGEEFEETVKADGSSMTVYNIPDMDEKGPYLRPGVCSRNYDISLVDITFTWTQAIRRFLAQNLAAIGNGVSGFYRTCRYFLGEAREGRITGKQALLEITNKRYVWLSPLVKVIRASDDQFVGYAMREGLLEKLSNYNAAYGDSISIQGELIGPGIQSNYENVDTLTFYVYQVFRKGKLWVSPEEARVIVDAMGLNYIPVLNTRVKLPPSVKECLKRADGPGSFGPDVKREGVVFKSLTRDFSFKAISNAYLLSKEAEMAKEEAEGVE